MATKTTADQYLERLEDPDENIPWNQRRIWARYACDRLSRSLPPPASLAIARILAADSKWEVRMAVAEKLANFPEPLFRELSQTLAADNNAFVARTARVALARRSPASRAGTKSRNKGHQQMIEAIRGRHGSEAAKMAVDLANRQSDDYLRSVAHDIKTILTPAKELVRKLQDCTDSNATSPAGLLARLRTSVDDLQSLTEDISEFARSVTVRKSDENVAMMLADAERTARENIEARGGDCACVSCGVTVDSALKVCVSRPLFVMALTNLIKNAIEIHERKSGFETATVIVTAAINDGILDLSISDMGGPLEPSEVAKIQQFIPGGSSKPAGSGFGLPIARRNIERHGGTLRLEPNGQTGLTARIQIPP